MTIHPSRRAFLLEVARTTAYVAPALLVLGAPDSLAAQSPPSQKGKGTGKGKGLDQAPGQNPQGAVRTAPWDRIPPDDD